MALFFLKLSFVSIVFVSILFLLCAFAVYLERKVAGYIQERYGPNRVGPFGILQPFADFIKILFKEELSIGESKILYFLAPILVTLSTLLSFAVIPFSEKIILVNLDVGILYLLAVSPFAVYGLFMAGLSKPSKYSFLGGLRSISQLLSYEIPMILAIFSLVIFAESFNLVEIVEKQRNMWNIIPQFVGFLVFLISIFAETNRLPFDLPEAESELVAGYHAEYSGFKFALFFLGEYLHLIFASFLITTFYLGGWLGPFIDGPHWLFVKAFLVFYFFLWVRWTLPRLRFDQLMSFSWKFLLPVAIINLLLTGAIKLWVS